FTCASLLSACGTGQKNSDPFSAVASNDAGALRSYLDQGGDPNARSVNGESLVSMATGPHGGEAVLRLLLEPGAKPDDGVGRWSPLMNASAWCRPGSVSLLLNAGANPGLRNEAGQAALETVCSRGSGRDEVIALLSRQQP